MDQDFEAFAPTLEKVIGFQKKFAGYRAKDGKKTYDIMLDDYEKGFSMENLDEFFGLLKKELVPFLKKVMEEGKKIEDGFLKGDYPEEKQEELARFLAGYVGFDFDCGVMAVSAILLPPTCTIRMCASPHTTRTAWTVPCFSVIH